MIILNNSDRTESAARALRENLQRCDEILASHERMIFPGWINLSPLDKVVAGNMLADFLKHWNRAVFYRREFESAVRLDTRATFEPEPFPAMIERG